MDNDPLTAPLLEAGDLSKAFGGFKAVDSVSFSVEAGHVVGLVGPNGAGKTTLFDLISGFLAPDAGELRLNGTRLNGLAPHQRVDMGIGRLFQDVHIFGRLSALDNVLAAARSNPGERPLTALLRPGEVAAAEARNLETARQWIGFVGLAAKAGHLAGTLSYGEQKLAALARVLAGGPNLLLLDEPVSGLAPAAAEEMLALVRRLAKDEGKTVLLIEHEWDAVRAVADYVLLMENGRITRRGPAHELLPQGSGSSPAGSG